MARDITRSYTLPDSVLGLGIDEDVYIIEGDFDPTVATGQPAPLGSLFLRRDVPSLYLKDSAPDTGWSQLGSGTAAFTNRLQTVYVGKHGSASPASNGRVPDDPYDTFAGAIAYVNTQSPASGNRWSIICEDGGTYTESFTIPSWVFVKAPNATFNGNIVLSDNSEFVFQEAIASTGDVISKIAGTSTAWATGEIVRSTGAANGLVNGAVASILIVRVRQVYTENGTAILDNSTGLGHIHMDVEDLYITGTGTAVDRGSNTGIIVGRVSHILEQGAGIGNGTALDITDGRMTLTVGTIDCATAYSVQGSGSLNLIVNEITEPTNRIQTSGSAEVNVIEADSLRWRNRNADFTARRTEFVAVDTSGGPVTMDLPNPASNGDSVTFQDSQNTFGTNNLTVDAQAGGLIDDGGSGSQTIVLEISGTSGIFIYNETLGLWTFARIQEEVAFSPSNVIYVTKNGSDTIGDGSFSNPYLTVKKGATEALAVASAANPTTVKVLDGVYDEVNPITISGANSEFVQIQGSEAQSTIVRPTVNGQPLFDLASNSATDGPSLSRLTAQGQNNGGTDYETVAGSDLVRVSGDGIFSFDAFVVNDGFNGLNAGQGTVTTGQIIRWTNGSANSNTTGLNAIGANTEIIGDVVSFNNQNGTAISLATGANVQLSNYDITGNVGAPAGTGILIDDTSTLFANGGSIRGLLLGLSTNGTSTSNILATTFLDNTTDFNQVDATARVVIQGNISKTKQLISDGALVSLNYIDTDTVDFIVGNADATGDPGKEFRVRDFDGRIAIGDNATDANIATGGVGGSRTLNLIDTNGNFRIWRFVTVDGQDPAMEWIKGVNPANPDGFGDAPITAITAATDTITIDVSSIDYGDPLTEAGIDRTTLAERAFPTGREIRVNGTVSNDGDYVVSSATYNSGPQTIDVVVTTDITVDEATGELVFGGGAGRDDGVSTYVGDPGAAVAAGAGNVWWDMFLQEDDYFVVRRRTGGGGSLPNEKLRLYQDRLEILGSSLYDDSDNNTIAVFQNVPGTDNEYLEIRNSVQGTGVGPEIAAVGAGAEIAIELIPKGTATVTVPAGYEDNVVAESLINQAYLTGTFSQFHQHNGATTQTYTAATTILFPTVGRADTDYTYAAGEVTINTDGWYEVSYDLTVDNGGNGRRTGTHLLELNTVAVPGSVSNTYHRNAADGESTGSAKVLLNLTAGDVLRVRSSGSASIVTVADGCRFNIERKL